MICCLLHCGPTDPLPRNQGHLDPGVVAGQTDVSVLPTVAFDTDEAVEND